MSAAHDSFRRYPAHPIPAIGVVVWRGDDILMVQRAKPPREGQWGLIGGVQETGETHFEAAIREVHEETGVTVEPFGIITALDGMTRDAQGQIEFHYSIVEVNARYVSGTPTAGSDARAVRWVVSDELGSMPIWPEIIRVVALAKEQRG